MTGSSSIWDIMRAHMSRLFLWVPVCALVSLSGAVGPSSHAAEEIPGTDEPLPPGLPEPEQARKLITIPKGLKIELWAREPLVQNGVGFGFDGQGRLYVAEGKRGSVNVLDI